MNHRLTMNTQLGTKWFTFFTKIRPLLAVISFLVTIVQVSQNFKIYLSHIGLLISLLTSIVQTVLCVMVASKADDDDYEAFVRFVKIVLLFDVCSMTLQTGIRQYYENPSDWGLPAIVAAVILLLGYFLWYRLNMRYFSKRLMTAAAVPIVSCGDGNSSLHTSDEYTASNATASAPKKKSPWLIVGLILMIIALLSLVVVFAGNLIAPDDPASSATSAPTLSPSAEPSPSPAPESILPEDFVADTSAEDICLATTGIPGDFELFTVNGIPVSGYAYLYYLSGVITSFEESIIQTYGTMLDWTTSPELVDSVGENALHTAALYTLLPEKAKEMGCDLTEEMRSELEAALALTIQYMGGEEAFFDELRKSGLDFDTFYFSNTIPYYLSQIQAKLAPAAPTDEELNAYIQENDLLRAKHILLMTVDPVTGEPLDEAAIAQKKAAAEEILAKLQSSSDLIADFDKLMNEHSEDSGLIANPNGYTFTAGQMVEAFESGTRALAFDQVSGIVESPYGYHIILRLDPATEELRAQCYDSLAREALNARLNAWMEDAQIVKTPEYESFDLPLFYAKFNAYYEAFQTEAAAKAEAQAQATTSPDAGSGTADGSN